MKDRYLFKAKRKDNGKWEEGYYVKKIEWHRIGDEYVKTERHYICVNMVSSEDSYIDRIEVVPETICQYTGLTDKNGNKIWENDVVKGRHWAEPKNIHRFRVDWSEKSGLIVFKDSLTIDAEMSIHDFCDFREVEIIGNIFDNPELVKGGV